jgi:hypothetical protein
MNVGTGDGGRAATAASAPKGRGMATMTFARITIWAVAAAVLFGAVSAAVDFRSGEEVRLSGAFQDVLFAAGGRVHVEATSSDDIYVAGRTITVDGARADDLVVAGETAIFNGFEAADVTAAGRALEMLEGVIGDDLIAAGASVNLAEGLEVRGSAVLSGAEVIVEAPIGAELRAAGERVRLDAVVGGDVELAGRRIVVGPKARIGGNLTHRADTIEIDPAAEIAGEIIAREPRAADVAERWAGKAIAGAIMFGLVFLLGFVVLVALIATLLPALMRDSDQAMRRRPFATLGIGFLIAFAAPVGIAAFAASVVGLPVALMLAAVFATAAPVAIAATAYYLGRRASALAARGAAPGEPRFGARLGWTALAVLALLIVGLIPFVGALAWLVAYVFGLGAASVRAVRALAVGPAPVSA